MWSLRAWLASLSGPRGQFIGTVGERGDFILRLVEKRGLPETDRWEARTLYKFKDAQGNSATWFASGAIELHDAVVGQSYEVRARVRDHSVYNGVRETYLERAKLSPLG